MKHGLTEPGWYSNGTSDARLINFRRQVIMQPEDDSLSGEMPTKCQLFDILPVVLRYCIFSI